MPATAPFRERPAPTREGELAIDPIGGGLTGLSGYEGPIFSNPDMKMQTLGPWATHVGNYGGTVPGGAGSSYPYYSFDPKTGQFQWTPVPGGTQLSFGNLNPPGTGFNFAGGGGAPGGAEGAGYISPHYTGVAPGSGLGYGGASQAPWWSKAWDWMKAHPEQASKLKNLFGGGGDEYPGGGVNTYGDPSKMPGFYGAPNAALSELFRIMGDPYGADIDAARTRSLKGKEMAYDVAGQRLGSNIFGSGAEESGVAKGVAGNLEVARAEGLADEMADWEEFRLMLGDERLRSLLMPYLQAYNQAYGTAMGTPTYKQGGSNWTDYVDTAMEIYKLFA